MFKFELIFQIIVEKVVPIFINRNAFANILLQLKGSSDSKDVTILGQNLYNSDVSSIFAL